VADILPISAHAKYRDRFPRTSREAGVDHLEWEDRIKPLRPWIIDIRDGLLCVAVFAVLTAIIWRI
jgi:hypothetical protein